ncbi:hypothetical protein KCU62_g8082, partial [Aureobasidium sp. EXF-3399]
MIVHIKMIMVGGAKSKFISEEDLNTLADALNVTLEEPQHMVLIPENEEAETIFRGVSKLWQNHTEWSLEDIRDVAEKWKLEVDRIRKALDKSKDSLKLSKQTEDIKRSEHYERVKALEAEVKKKDRLIREAETANDELISDHDKAIEEKQEKLAELEAKLEEERQRVKDIKENYNSHIEYTQRSDHQDSLEGEFLEAFRSARFQPPENTGSLVGYLNQALDALVSCQTKLKDESSKLSLYKQWYAVLSDSNESLQKTIDKLTESEDKTKDKARVSAAKVEEQERRIADQATEIRNLQSKVKTSTRVQKDVEVQNDALRKLVKTANKERDKMQSRVKDNASLKAEFESIRIMLKLPQDYLREKLTSLTALEREVSTKLENSQDRYKPLKTLADSHAAETKNLNQKSTTQQMDTTRLETEAEPHSQHTARLRRDMDSLKDRLEEAEEARKLVQADLDSIHQHESAVIKDLRAKLDKALETSADLQTALDKSRDVNQKLDAQHNKFKAQIMEAIGARYSNTPWDYNIVRDANDLRILVDDIRNTLEIDEDVDICEHIKKNLYTRKEVDAFVNSALEPAREALSLAHDGDVEDAVYSIISEQSILSDLLSHIALSDDTEEGDSARVSKVKTVLETIKLLQNAIGDKEGTQAYVDEVRKSKVSDKALTKINTALDGIPGESAIAKIKYLKDLRLELQAVCKALNVSDLSAADRTIKLLKADHTKMSDIRKELTLSPDEQVLETITRLKKERDEINTAFTSLSQSVEGLSAVQIVTSLIPELLLAIKHFITHGASLTQLSPRLSRRLLATYNWDAHDHTPLPQTDLSWELITGTSASPDSCSQIISRLRLLLFSETPVPLPIIQALLNTFEQCVGGDLVRLVELLEVYWSDGPLHVDAVHAFATARMIEFIVRGVSNRDHGATQVYRMIALWTTIYPLRDPLLTAYSRWFQSLLGTPSTMPRLLQVLYEEAIVQIMREPGTSRIFYCNVLPGYHLIADGNRLHLFEEDSLEIDGRTRLISFPDDRIAPFMTNLPHERLNPVIRRYMRSLWVRTTFKRIW